MSKKDKILVIQLVSFVALSLWFGWYVKESDAERSIARERIATQLRQEGLGGFTRYIDDMSWSDRIELADRITTLRMNIQDDKRYQIALRNLMRQLSADGWKL